MSMRKKNLNLFKTCFNGTHSHRHQQTLYWMHRAKKFTSINFSERSEVERVGVGIKTEISISLVFLLLENFKDVLSILASSRYSRRFCCTTISYT